VIEVQGYLFFGTAERLRERVRSRIADPGRPPLLRLVLDFHHVVGLDAAAAAVLQRIASIVAENGGALVLSGCRADLQSAILRAAPGLNATIVPSLDEALEQAEDAVLAQQPQTAAGESAFSDLFARLPADRDQLERLFGTLPVEQLPKGSIVLRAGELADSLVFLEQGRVVVRLPTALVEGARLRAMSAGAVLGDIGLALGTRRTADVVAATDIAIRRLTQRHLSQFEREDPLLALAVQRLLSRALAERIVRDESRTAAGAEGP
jgi:SulP family sulfate permease